MMVVLYLLRVLLPGGDAFSPGGEISTTGSGKWYRRRVGECDESLAQAAPSRTGAEDSWTAPLLPEQSSTRVCEPLYNVECFQHTKGMLLTEATRRHAVIWIGSHTNGEGSPRFMYCCLCDVYFSLG